LLRPWAERSDVQTVSIFGVGLIGGSFGLALRKAGFTGRIIGVSSPATITRAIELGVIDEGRGALDAAGQSDLVFLAQPIRAIIETIGSIAPVVSPNAFVTDAGSTKSSILAALAGFLQAGSFVGGHPLAGRERRGVDAASADLFQGRPWALTPANPDDLGTPKCAEFVGWIERIGASPLVLEAPEHDRIAALTSHLPQLASTALAATLEDAFAGGPPALRGPGLEDMTRLALSSWEVWRDILDTNRGNVTAALEAWIETLGHLRGLLASGDDGDIQGFFQRAAAFATVVRRAQSDSQDNIFT